MFIYLSILLKKIFKQLASLTLKRVILLNSRASSRPGDTRFLPRHVTLDPQPFPPPFARKCFVISTRGRDRPNSDLIYIRIRFNLLAFIERLADDKKTLTEKEKMGTCVEASYGDHHYLKYKAEMEGMGTKGQVGDNLPAVTFAIFGLGRIGTIHLDNLCRNPRARIVFCVEESDDRINYVRNKWKLMEPGTTFLKPSEQEKVFEDESVDAVIVCTPTFTHEDIVLNSLRKGKAVFCEKPLALDDEGIERCLDAAKKYNRTLLCAFNRRFDPGLITVKNRLSDGEIGKVQIVKMCSRDSPKPSLEYLKISGGIFHDCAVHDIDYICWILGEYPTSVSSFAHTHFEDIKQLDDMDTVCIIMKFPSGTLATIDLSRCAVYGYDQRVEVFGEGGMLTCGEQRPVGVRAHNGKGTTAVPIFFSFASRYQESYENEIEHFIDVCQGSEECSVDGSSILAVSKIAAACEESARKGKTIYLDWGKEQNGVNGF